MFLLFFSVFSQSIQVRVVSSFGTFKRGGIPWPMAKYMSFDYSTASNNNSNNKRTKKKELKRKKDKKSCCCRNGGIVVDGLWVLVGDV
jgi:hypothetical protein